MKTTSFFVEKYPVPDQKATKLAVYDALSKPKLGLQQPYAIIFLGLFAIHVLAFTDPFGTHPLASYLPWAVLLASFIAMGFLLAKAIKSSNELMRQIDECYANYLNDPIHIDYKNEISYYHGCLADWKYLCFENKHLVAFNKLWFIEDRWLEHIRQFGPTSISSGLLKMPRGEKLRSQGFFPFYSSYGKPLRLSQLYKDHLTFEETCSFLAMYKQLKASFDDQPDEKAFTESLISIKKTLTDEEAELLKETNECLAEIIDDFSK